MKVISLAEAVALIPDGASLMIGGFMARRHARARDRRTGAPGQARPHRDRQRHRDARRRHRQAGRAPGCVRKAIVSHIGLNPETQQQMIAGEMEVELVPQGTLIERIRAGGFGLGGVLTPTGVGTVVEEGKQKIDGRRQGLPAGDRAARRLRARPCLPGRLPRQPGLRADRAQLQPGDRDGRRHRDRRGRATSCRSA